MENGIEKKQNKKVPVICVVAMIIVVAIVTIICIKVIPQKEETEKTLPKEIDYSILDFEVDDGNIQMIDTEFAEVKDGVKRNHAEKVKEEKEYNGYKIKEGAIEATSGISQFIARIYNDTEKMREDEIIEIIFIDKNENEITRVETMIHMMEPNSEGGLQAVTDIDITDAVDYKIEAKKEN